MSHHIHILFAHLMGLGATGEKAGFSVTGSDRNIYPPMSTSWRKGIDLVDGYGAEQLDTPPDCVVVGNALSRASLLWKQCSIRGCITRPVPSGWGDIFCATSGSWVSGTHGKTSTASMLTWILDHAGMAPGFLIGGVPGNFGVSAAWARSFCGGS